MSFRSAFKWGWGDDGGSPLPPAVPEIQEFEPDQEARKQDGWLPLTLPETLYTALVAGMMNNMRAQLLGLWVWVVIAAFCQMYSTYRLRVFTYSEEGSCYTDGDWVLKFICTFMLVVVAGNKVMQQVDTLRYLSRFPSEDLPALPSQSTPDPSFFEGGERGGMVFRTRSVPPCTYPATKLKPTAMCWCGIFVVYQLLLSACFFWVGAPYILQAKDTETVLLNAMALTFILDIDSVFYTLAIDSYIRGRLLSKMQTTLQFHEFKEVKSYVHSRPLILAVGGVLLTGGSWTGWCS